MIKLLLPGEISKKTGADDDEMSLDQESDEHDDEVDPTPSKKGKQPMIRFIDEG